MLDINASKGDRTYELSPTTTKDEILRDPVCGFEEQ